MTRDDHDELDERLLHRLLFFSDAVFAIVLTLLVLELKPPEGLTLEQLGDGLRHMLPRLSAFAMSFALVSIFWMAHMSTTSPLRRFDWPTALANLLFLFPICLIPFVSAWLGGSLGNPFTWQAYCWVLVATSAANVILVVVLSRGGGRLVGGITPREILHRALRAASPGVAFGLGIALVAMGQYLPAQYCWVLIPVFLWIEGRFFPRDAAKPATTPAPRSRRRS